MFLEPNILRANSRMNSLKQTWANLFGDEPVKRRGPTPDWANITPNSLGSTRSRQRRRRPSPIPIKRYNKAHTKKHKPKADKKRSASPPKTKKRTPSPAKHKDGDLVRGAGSYQIYKKGSWVPYEGEVYNAEGRYGGPYSDMRQLQANPAYVAEMEARHGANWKEAEKKARRAAKVAAKAAAAAGTNQKGGKTRRRRA